MSEHTSYIIAAIVAIIGAAKPVVICVRWIVDKIESRGEKRYVQKVKDDFIFDVAVNHLPHIENSLEQIATHLNLKLAEPPPIRYLPFDPNKS